MKNVYPKFLILVVAASFFIVSVGMAMEKPEELPASQNKNREELLINALRDGNLEKVKQIFDQDGSNVNDLLNEEWPSLMVAAKFGHENIVRYLIKDKRADAHWVDKEWLERTPLMVAAHQGHFNVVKCILENSNNPTDRKYLINSVDCNSLNAFYHAAENGKLEVVKYFAEYPDFDRYIHGTTALSLANNKNYDAVVQYLISKGVSPLPKRGNSADIRDIFYDNEANNCIKLDDFEIIAHTVKPIAGSSATLNIYQPRVLKQTAYGEECIEQQLELAVKSLGGTKEMHSKASPIFGGSCSYHAIKNALIGLMLLHDYDALVRKCTMNDSEKTKLADLVSGDIKNFTVLTTPQFDCENFMEKIHAKIFMIQHQPLWQKIEAINIQEGGGSERMHIACHEFDSTLNTVMAKRDKDFQKKSVALSFVNDETIYNNFFCINGYEALYENEGGRLAEMLEKIQNFDLVSQIALFRTNKNYRHAFNLSLNTGLLEGRGQSCIGSDSRMHAITVILDKRDSVINAIVFESNNHAPFAIKQILFDFLDHFIDDKKYPMPDEIRDDLVSCSKNPYGFALTYDQKNKLPTFESLVRSYSPLKQECAANQKRDDVHKALFLLAKINHVYTQAKDCADHGMAPEEFKQIQAVLAKYGALHEDNKIREEEIALCSIIQAIEEKELNERMFSFIIEEDESKIRETIKIGANPNGTRSNSNTPLCDAAYRNLSIVKCLVESGAKIDGENKSGQTPLMIAAERGDHAIIEYLIGQGALVNAQDNNGNMPLMYAAGILGADSKRFEIAKCLIEQCKADFTIKNNAGQDALMVYAICGAYNVFDYLVKEHKLTIDLPILISCIAHEKVTLGYGSYGPFFNLELIEYCIKERNLNVQENPQITLDLAIAAAKRHRIDVIKRLCQKDCEFDINMQDANGQNLLMHICDDNYRDTLKKIIEEFQPNIDAKNNTGKTVFDIAAQNGSIRILDYLTKNCGFSIDTPDCDGFTPLLHAAAKGDSLTLQSLIEWYKPNIGARDKEGRTVLMIAAGNHINGVECEAGECNPGESQDDWFGIPKKNNHKDIVKYLVKQGSDVKAVDKNGRTALMHAKLAGRDKVAEYLENIK